MAVTVNANDYVKRHTHDATASTFGVGTGVNSPSATDTTIKVEGAASTRARVTSAALGGVGATYTAFNPTGLHLGGWVNDLDASATRANNGWRMRWASTQANMTSNYAERTVGGQDTYVAPRNGFQHWVCNPRFPAQFSAGTPPTTSVGAHGFLSQHQTSSARDTYFSDNFASWSSIHVRGGTGGSPGQSSEVAADDATNGRGIFIDVAGVYFVNGGIVIGDNTGTASEFNDKLATWVFQDQPVDPAFHKVQLLGHATGAQNATFGVKTGTGVTATGGQGYTFQTASSTGACFSVEAIDANQDKAAFYGCNFVGSRYICPADDVFVEDNSAGPSFSSISAATAYNDASNGALFPATEANNDAFYCGSENHPFIGLNMVLSTAGVGAPTLAREYWNGSAWTALPGLVDGTSGLTASGEITWALPPEWATTAVNGVTAYWVRVRIVSGTFSTNPVANVANTIHVGEVRFETANVEALSCLFVGMGTVTVRNGAILRSGTVITASNAGVRGALDLGSADPATDTVRDLSISNCARGILLKGTSTGATTYNLRNIKFSGNTNDIRVDFPAAATITINVLEGGSDPTIENVNGSTIIKVVAPVTVKVVALNEAGSPLQNVRVMLKAIAGGGLPAAATVTITQTGGTATVTHTAHGMGTGDKVAIFGANQAGYDGVRTITVTGANTYTYATTGSPASPATGTITSTFVALYGLTDVNGEIQASRTYSTSQPVTGWTRDDGVSSPFLKTGLLQGTISNTTGYNATSTMVADE